MDGRKCKVVPGSEVWPLVPSLPAELLGARPREEEELCAVWVCVVAVCWAARLSSSTLHQYPRLWGVGGFILGAFVVQMLDHPKRCETRGL